MYYYQKFAIVGFSLSLLPVILCIISLTTPPWITIDFIDSTNSFSTPRYLQIIGYIILIIGLFIAILCTTFIDKHPIHFLAPIIIIIGNLIIIIGLFAQLFSVVKDLSVISKVQVHFGFSLVAMILTTIFGFLSAFYFSYTAGYIHRHILSTFNFQ